MEANTLEKGDAEPCKNQDKCLALPRANVHIKGTYSLKNA